LPPLRSGSNEARIRTAAQQVSSRANGLSGLSGGAYRGMEQQSGEIVSMAGAVEEFSATSLNIADNMGNTERLAQQTRIGRASMQEASSSLEQISVSITSTATVINTLGQLTGNWRRSPRLPTRPTFWRSKRPSKPPGRASKAEVAVVADEVCSLATRTRDATN
jgi:methyl-accepting chemotaxis protein